MKLLRCPINGLRPLSEFVYGGEVRAMPSPNTVADEEWADYVFNRQGEPGVRQEWWHHTASGTWFVAERDNLKDEFLRTYLYQDRPTSQPAEAPSSATIIEVSPSKSPVPEVVAAPTESPVPEPSARAEPSAAASADVAHPSVESTPPAATSAEPPPVDSSVPSENGVTSEANGAHREQGTRELAAAEASNGVSPMSDDNVPSDTSEVSGS